MEVYPTLCNQHDVVDMTLIPANCPLPPMAEKGIIKLIIITTIELVSRYQFKLVVWPMVNLYNQVTASLIRHLKIAR